MFIVFFKQKTAYEMRISDWSSDVCSSDLILLFAGVQRAGPAHAAHHLVEDEENPVAVADLPGAPEIAGNRRGRPECRTDYGFGDERGDTFAAEPLYLRLQLIGDAPPIGFVALVVPPVAVGLTGCDVAALNQIGSAPCGERVGNDV